MNASRPQAFRRRLAACLLGLVACALFTGSTAAQIVADFQATPTTGDFPLAVTFTDASTNGTVVSRQWDFGDGTQGVGVQPVHVYQFPGTYSVWYSVVGSGGPDDVDSEFKADLIHVTNGPTAVDFVASPAQPIAGQSVQFTDASTGWPQGSTRLWDFGDGSTSLQLDPAHMYLLAGTYTVNLTVSYGSLSASAAPQEVTLLAVSPAFSDFLTPVGVGDANVLLSGVADLDADGDIDIVAALAGTTSFGWFENTDGAASFSDYERFVASAGAFALTDLDRDGRLDLATKLNWFEHSGGQVSFDTSHPIPPTTQFTSELANLEAGDINGDGHMDLLRQASALGTLSEWLDNHGGQGLVFALNVIPTVETGALLRDLDMDGDLDIVKVRSTGLHFLANTDGLGTFANNVNIPAAGGLPRLLADVDGDGDLDLVNSGSWTALQGTVVWQTTAIPTADDPVAVADLDGDGDQDVLWHDFNTAWLQFRWTENLNGLGHFGPPQLITSAPAAAGETYPLAPLGDLDRDGDGDLLWRQASDVHWLRNDVSPSPWTHLDGGAPGFAGTPELRCSGTLVGGDPLTLTLTHAPPNTAMLAWLSAGLLPVQVLGGTLHANPPTAQLMRSSDLHGTYSDTFPWLPGVPAGITFYLQFIVQDFSVPAQLTLSNAVTATTP